MWCRGRGAEVEQRWWCRGTEWVQRRFRVQRRCAEVVQHRCWCSGGAEIGLGVLVQRRRCRGAQWMQRFRVLMQRSFRGQRLCRGGAGAVVVQRWNRGGGAGDVQRY